MITIKLKDDSWSHEQAITVKKRTLKAALKEVSKLVYITETQLETLKKEGLVKLPGITIWRVL